MRELFAEKGIMGWAGKVLERCQRWSLRTQSACCAAEQVRFARWR